MFKNIVVIAAVGLTIILTSLFIIIRSKKNTVKREQLLKKILEEKQFEFYLFDLRSLEEYSMSHIPGAISYPIEEIDNFLPTEKMFLPLFVYGSSLRQASLAVSFLSDKGYFNVQSLGTLKTWKGDMETDRTVSAINLLNTSIKELK